jgi:hypothetical protein
VKESPLGRRSGILMNDCVFSQFVAGENPRTDKVFRCATLGQAHLKRIGEVKDKIPRRTSTKVSVVLDNETARLYHAATSESEVLKQLAKRSVVTGYLVASTNMLKLEENLTLKGRRLFKNIITDICFRGDDPFFQKLISAEKLAETWRSLRPPEAMGRTTAEPFDRALGAAAALFLCSPNFRMSSLPSERVCRGELLVDTDQVLCQSWTNMHYPSNFIAQLTSFLPR